MNTGRRLARTTLRIAALGALLGACRTAHRVREALEPGTQDENNCARFRAEVARLESARGACERNHVAQRQRARADQDAALARCVAQCAPDGARPPDTDGCIARCRFDLGSSYRFSEWAIASQGPCPGEAQRTALERCEQRHARWRDEQRLRAEIRRAHLEEPRRDPRRARVWDEARRAANAAMVSIPPAVFVLMEYGQQTRVRLPGFLIDRTEVDVAAYAMCVEAGFCRAPPDAAGCNFSRQEGRNHPMNCLAAEDARRYCLWRNARLPTEPEWDYAARGDDRRVYAWGLEYPGARAQWSGDCGGRGCRGGTAPVGSHPLDRSPFGLLDMTGNVREWVSDPLEYVGGEVTDPHNPAASYVLRGGSWGVEDVRALRCSFRHSVFESDGNADGVRCARQR
jgi:iron(II)-dependent oxidoreductase